MCGIAGIFHLDQRPCDRESVRRLTDAIAHRGPDGEGVYTDGPVGLGHRRLAILDLSDSGKQPMQFGNRYWITYNGEVYNFVELRRELEGLGHRFQTESDTEVVLAAYQQWGAECVLKMNGMWAFAIWDRERREMFLSRDRFGVKPLHYLSEPHRFVFASELKAFLYLKDFVARENEDESRRQIATGIDSQEQTLIQHVMQLRPGHNMLVCATKVRIWRWWYTLDHIVEVPKRFADQVEQFRELFLDACRLRLRSDVPIATCLSGGLDSSSIVCALAAMNKSATSRLTSDYHRAFVATFQGTGHDEREYAEAAIEKAGAEPRYFSMNPGALLHDMMQYAYDYDVIGGQGLLLPVWAIYRELRRDKVVVSLDGLGVDELLVGYARSIKALLGVDGSLLRKPLRTLDLAYTLHRLTPYDSVPRILSESDPLVKAAWGIARKAKRIVNRAPLKTPISGTTWLNGSVEPEDAMDERERKAVESLTPLNQNMYWEFHYGGNWLLLQRYDRVSMAHGIESRLPYMDWRLVTFVFSLPDESKIGYGYTKRILREAMRGILPEKIRTRIVKIGFQSPLENWMNAELGDWALQRAQTKHFLDNPLTEGVALRDYIAQRQATKSWAGTDSKVVWRYLQADLWREAFFSKRGNVTDSESFAQNLQSHPSSAS